MSENHNFHSDSVPSGEVEVMNDNVSDISYSSCESSVLGDEVAGSSKVHLPVELHELSIHSDIPMLSPQHRRGSGDLSSNGAISGAAIINSRSDYGLAPSLSSRLRQKFRIPAEHRSLPDSRADSRGFQQMYRASNPNHYGSEPSSTEASYVYGQNGSWLRLKPKELSGSRRDSLLSSSEVRSVTDNNEGSKLENQKMKLEVMEEGVNELQEKSEVAHVSDSTLNGSDQNLDSSMDPSIIISGKLDCAEIDPNIQIAATAAAVDVHKASNFSKYERYHCAIDRFQGDRSIEIPILTFRRPHMRAFHLAWISFFTAFFTWFAIAPLLKEIKETLGLDHDQIWLSNVMNSTAAIVCRLFVGPLCDAYGARWVMASVLIISAIPVVTTGLVQTATELYILRFFTGIAGASFVVSQYWTSSMFTKEISGTANSLVAGWGNLGGAFAQLIMGSALFPLFKLFFSGPNGTEFEKVEAAEKAWRTVCIVPALLSLIMAFVLLRFSDDLPKGNVTRMRRLGQMHSVQVSNAAREAACNRNTWILAIHYGCSFGVEVTMTTGAALFFSETFDLSTESAAAIASIFGWLNLFARGLGGFTSDILNVKLGMRGRLLFQMGTLIFQGIFLLVFSYTKTLGGAIGVMIAFSLFVQLGEGSTFSITPYVCPNSVGSVAGIIGAGGNMGSVLFLVLIQKKSYHEAFRIIGMIVLSCSVSTLFIHIRGHACLIWGKEAPELIEIRQNRRRSLKNRQRDLVKSSNADNSDSA